MDLIQLKQTFQVKGIALVKEISGLPLGKEANRKGIERIHVHLKNFKLFVKHSVILG